MAFFSRNTQPARSPETFALATVAPDALIGLRNIEKSYAHGTSRSYVLRRINLDVKDGEFISIMGPSGAGKSTLLHIIGMHDSAWTGDYYFVDQPVHKLAPRDRSKLHKQYVGFVFQSYHLLDHLTVAENLDVPLSYRDIRKPERESLVCDILDKEVVLTMPGAVVHADDVQERRFPRARRPHDGDELSLLHVQVDAAEHVGAAGAMRVRFLDVPKRDEGVGRERLTGGVDRRLGGLREERHGLLNLSRWM